MVVWRIRRPRRPRVAVVKVYGRTIIRPIRAPAAEPCVTDNGGDWWLATCSNTVAQLRRLFREERAPGVLYDVVGQVRPTGRRDGGLPVVEIQLKVDHVADRQAWWAVDTCLTELNIGLLEQLPTRSET